MAQSMDALQHRSRHWKKQMLNDEPCLLVRSQTIQTISLSSVLLCKSLFSLQNVQTRQASVRKVRMTSPEPRARDESMSQDVAFCGAESITTPNYYGDAHF